MLGGAAEPPQSPQIPTSGCSRLLPYTLGARQEAGAAENLRGSEQAPNRGARSLSVSINVGLSEHAGNK